MNSKPQTILEWHLHAYQLLSEHVGYAVARMKTAGHEGDLNEFLDEAFRKNPGFFSSRDHLKSVHSDALDAQQERIRKAFDTGDIEKIRKALSGADLTTSDS